MKPLETYKLKPKLTQTEWIRATNKKEYTLLLILGIWLGIMLASGRNLWILILCAFIIELFYGYLGDKLLRVYEGETNGKTK